MPRSPSPRRDRETDRSRDYDRSDRRPRSRSRSPPPKSSGPKRVKELSFYKKGGGSSSRRDMDEPETEKERMQRRERGEVPARFGGTRQQGVRNTMSLVAPQGTAAVGMGSLKRTADPLDRMGVRGEEKGEPGRNYGREMERERERERGSGGGGSDRQSGDKAREERMKAMDKPQALPTSAPSYVLPSDENDKAEGSGSLECG